MKKLVGKATWFLDKKATVGTENNENRGGSAPGNPMLATPNSSANCGGENNIIQSDSVDAEKNEIGGESAPGNHIMTPPGLEGSKHHPVKEINNLAC